MEENRRVFGYMPDGTPVEEITLHSDQASCKILTYGAAVRSLLIPSRNGSLVDVALGFDTLEDYIAQDKYMGAIVGRYANRIGGAKFTLNGEEYALAANDGPNSLHGGNVGFDKQVWTVEALTDRSVTLSLVSPDMQEGYPGTLKVEVTYTLEYVPDPIFGQTKVRQLSIEYRAVCDKDTVFNPTNHTYFNLSGHDSGPVDEQFIRLEHASQYTPTGPGSIPTGEIAPVDGTPMDLRKVLRIGAYIDADFDQLTMAGGYDHNWVLDPCPAADARVAALAYSLATDIYLMMSTTMPGVQFYTGNFIQGCPTGKGGAVYGNRHGFCLETQFFPDTPNKPGFPSCVLRAGEEFYSKTSYGFYCNSAEGL